MSQFQVGDIIVPGKQIDVCYYRVVSSICDNKLGLVACPTLTEAEKLSRQYREKAVSR